MSKKKKSLLHDWINSVVRFKQHVSMAEAEPYPGGLTKKLEKVLSDIKYRQMCAQLNWAHRVMEMSRGAGNYCKNFKTKNK